MIQIPLEIGDLILTGRFKNKKVTVKEISFDEYGNPTVNGRSILKIRIPKLYQQMTTELNEMKEPVKYIGYKVDQNGKVIMYVESINQDIGNEFKGSVIRFGFLSQYGSGSKDKGWFRVNKPSMRWEKYGIVWEEGTVKLDIKNNIKEDNMKLTELKNKIFYGCEFNLKYPNDVFNLRTVEAPDPLNALFKYAKRGYGQQKNKLKKIINNTWGFKENDNTVYIITTNENISSKQLIPLIKVKFNLTVVDESSNSIFESRESIMSKVANALPYKTKPMGHKDYLGFDNALYFVGLTEPLALSLIDKDQTLDFYRDTGDNVWTINEYDVNQLDKAVDAISAYISKNKLTTSRAFKSTTEAFRSVEPKLKKGFNFQSLSVGDEIKFKKNKETYIVTSVGYDGASLKHKWLGGVTKNINSLKDFEPVKVKSTTESVKPFQSTPIEVKIQKDDMSRWNAVLQTVNGPGDELFPIGFETKEQAEHAAMMKGYSFKGNPYSPKTERHIRNLVQRIVNEEKSLHELGNLNFKTGKKYKFKSPNGKRELTGILANINGNNYTFNDVYSGNNPDNIVKFPPAMLNSVSVPKSNIIGLAESTRLLEYDVTDEKAEEALQELARLTKINNKMEQEIAEIRRKYDAKNVNAKIKKILDEDVKDIMEECKKMDDRFIRTKNLVMEVHRFQYERTNYEYKKVVEYLLDKINRFMKACARSYMDTLKTVTQISADVSFTANEGKINEGFFDSIKKFASKLGSKLLSLKVVTRLWDAILNQGEKFIAKAKRSKSN